MKTRIASLLPLLALAACAKNNASVEIAAVCAPPKDASKCSFSSKCDMVNIGYNAIDVGVAGASLWLFLQVNNQLPNNGNLQTGRLNTNDAWVNEYEITFDVGLSDVTGPVPGGASMIPAGSSSVISILPIDATAASTLSTAVPAGAGINIVGHLRLKGVYADTTAFETGVFDVAIYACSSCSGTPPTCAAGDYLAVCPASWAQSPKSFKCVTP